MQGWDSIILEDEVDTTRSEALDLNAFAYWLKEAIIALNTEMAREPTES